MEACMEESNWGLFDGPPVRARWSVDHDPHGRTRPENRGPEAYAHTKIPGERFAVEMRPFHCLIGGYVWE